MGCKRLKIFEEPIFEVVHRKKKYFSSKKRIDYYPFGMPMPNRNIEGNYRYKFQGQEKDPETGMEAFELRLWDARIGRWLTTDPAGQYASPYLGMGNNPITRVDPDGGMDCDPCPDPPIATEVLPEIIITASSGSGGNSGFDFSGMPDFLKHNQPDTWNTSYTKDLASYNAEFGTDYTEGNQLNQWRYQNSYKPQSDDMISSIHSATNQAADLAMYILPTGPGVQIGTKALPVLGRYASKGYKYLDDGLQYVQLKGNLQIHSAKNLLINNSYKYLYKNAPKYLRRQIYPFQKMLLNEKNIFRNYLNAQLPGQLNTIYTSFNRAKNIFFN